MTGVRAGIQSKASTAVIARKQVDNTRQHYFYRDGKYGIGILSNVDSHCGG